MDLTDRIIMLLRTYPDGEPVPVGDIASEVGCTEDEIISAATALEPRVFGDRDIVSVLTRERATGEKETFLSRVATPLNEEPQT